MAEIEVVALVTSAGGMDALTAVLRGLPADLPAAILVQQHLGGHASVLPKILARRTGRAVVWAVDGEPIGPGPVTCCPAGMRLEVLPDGTCALSRVESAADRPHDHLLGSLADSYGPRALAVVLTGAGRDGAAGTAALSAAGGVVIAQDEDTAEYPSMPRAAAAAGAEVVLPLHEIADVVADVVRGGPVPQPYSELEAVRVTFGERGEVARLARETDWSLHALGPVRHWPAVLRGVVRLTMDSPHREIVYVGEHYICLFNDAAIPSFGASYADAFGRPNFEIFPSAEAALGPVFARVFAGDAVLLPMVRIPYPRNEQVSDSWYDLTYTTVRDEHGVPLGVHLHHYERTEQVLASRRLRTLSELSAIAVQRGRRGALELAVDCLAASDDVVFALAYLTTPTGDAAHLVAATGAGGSLAPRDVPLRPGGPGWPLGRVVESRAPVVVDDVAKRFPGHLVGTGRHEPGPAVVVPLPDRADDRVVGALILGAISQVPFDDAYREFFLTSADTVAGKVAESHAREREQQRLERLAELDRAKTEFFSNVSHEFRTPLTLMLAPLQEAVRRADDLPDDVADELRVAERNGRRLLRLVGTLLDFSQAEAGRLRARFVPVDLAELTTEIASMFRGAAEAAGLKLVIDAAPLPEPAWVDPEMWEKIVSNLLSNALKFTWDGSIEVVLRALPQHAELTVRDTGVGIPADELPHVLERFHRVREARGRTHEGTGIGLALVDELVRFHHGRIRTTSAEGVGTTFTVWLPTSRRPVGRGEPPPEAPIGQVATAMAEEAAHWDIPHQQAVDVLELDEPEPVRDLPGSTAARVLVVDDNADLRNYLVRLLGSTWHVRAARDGQEALDLARRNRPDLVLADVMVPRRDGFALLSAIRADEALADTPVVLLTARTGEETAIEGLLAGADDYVVKPFSPRELVARVKAQLQLARLRRRHAALDAFRVALTDTLRTISDPAEVQARAAELLGRHLGASRAYYQEFDHAAGTFTIHRNYTDGLPSLEGTYRLDDYGDELVDESHRTGRPLVVRDSADLDATAAASWAAVAVRAGVAAPNMRAGVCVAALGITSAEPRDWTDEEVALVEETAERTWAYVERVRAENELRASEERFRTVADTVPALIWQNDADGDNVFVNRYFLDYTGLSPEEIGGERWRTLVHPADADAYVSGYLSAVRERAPWHGRNRIRRFDGTWRTFDNYATPLFGADGTYLGHVGVSVDVTEG